MSGTLNNTLEGAAARLNGAAGADARADGGRRQVSIIGRRVQIERCIGGVPMRVRLDAGAFVGVALGVFDGVDGSKFFRITLVHRDPDLSVVLHESADDTELVALWRAWARRLGAPKLVIDAQGAWRPMERMIGDLALGPEATTRRRQAALRQRRPRYFARRQVMTRGPTIVHRGEDEIIART